MVIMRLVKLLFFFIMAFTSVVFMWTTPDVCYNKSFLFIKNSFDPFLILFTFMKKQILSFYQILFRDVLLETSILQPNVNVAQPHLLHVFCYLN